MNELINIQFNFIKDSIPVVIDNCYANVLITPMYCTESDVALEFLQEDSPEYSEFIRQKIFHGSLEIDKYIEMYGINVNLKPELLFMIKRDYVLCYCTYHVGSRLYIDYAASSKKEKFLGDIKVTLEIKNDPMVLKGKFEAAKYCMDSIMALFENWQKSKSMIGLFVKGETNSSSKTSSREWWWNMPGMPSISSPVAATKLMNPITHTMQKISSVNVTYYDQFK